MGEVSRIAWTDSTFNPWRGCVKVSPGCERCYAERDSKRNPAVLGVWGTENAGGTRVLASESMWRKPLAWNEEARKSGRRHLVFAASLADVFEEWDGPIVDSRGERCHHADGRPMVLDHVRARLFDLIAATPNLTWLLLTKRSENVMDQVARLAIGSVLCYDWFALGNPPRNVWLGCTAENQEWADRRIPELLKIPNVCPWVSYEPAIGPVDWSPYLEPAWSADADPDGPGIAIPAIRWIIIGGESGAWDKARPFDIAWARSTVAQCKSAGVACFVKQMGARPIRVSRVSAVLTGRARYDAGMTVESSIRLRDKAGADPSEWPEEFRVQEFPT